MGKSYGPIRDRLNLCSSCGKPIVDNNYYTITTNRKANYIYHNDYATCANAEPLPKDWYRQNDRTRTKTYNRTQARLHDSDGYTGDADDSVPMRF